MVGESSHEDWIVNVPEPTIVTPLPPLARAARRAGWQNGLTAALLFNAIIGGVYLTCYWPRLPPPGSAIGLTLGVIGLLLMFGAETLYTIRKRVRRCTYGSMSVWLHTHIFLGLVGAFLVVLHSAGKFQGLAGATVVVVATIIASGLVGRYIYTAAPRTIDGIEVDARELLMRFAAAEQRWQSLGVRLSASELAEFSLSPTLPGWAAVLGRSWLVWRQRRRARRFVRRWPTAARSAGVEWQRLLVDRYELQLDIRSVTAARRWLSWWYMLHVPLGMALFTLAAIHIVVALRYSLW